jgi:ABC-type Na+ transport system ATPase subunit NatA
MCNSHRNTSIDKPEARLRTALRKNFIKYDEVAHGFIKHFDRAEAAHKLCTTLLTNPKLPILDEPTSSIDLYTELVIQNVLKKLLENRLATMMDQRLSTIRLYDEIIVLDNGGVIERGTRSRLELQVPTIKFPPSASDIAGLYAMHSMLQGLWRLRCCHPLIIS